MTPAFHLVLPFLLAAVPGSSPATQPHHPTVYLTAAETARARQGIVSDPAAKAWFKSLCKGVDQWSDKTPEWVRGVMPEPGACFAYGFTGCPICGAAWGTWGEANTSFDKPEHVTCANGHTLPNEQFPDGGTGHVAKDKRIHYFVGSYNAWVVETLIFKLARPYSTIYLLSGDARAGRMAAVILDEIARIYPACDKGSWDYPSNPPSGRLDRPWYQVARVLVHLVDIYDRIHAHPALDEPSSVPGLTRRENIEKNMLLNGARYCFEQSHKVGRLSNGEADYLRGVLAVGVLLDIPEYVTWPVDGPYGIRTMIANNIDRDGQYFETSALYGLHTRDLYLTFAEPLLNCRGSVYPQGLNLYDDPRFQAFLLLPQMAMVCLGHNVPFGDVAPSVDRRRPPYLPPAWNDCIYAEHLAARASAPDERRRYAGLLACLGSRDPDAEKHKREMAEWRVFHGLNDGPVGQVELTDTIKRRLDGSFFFGQKGVAVLRSGREAAAHAAVLRFGPSLNHGHLDDLNVNYFARGYELTYDLGYGLGSTHTQVGWAHQTASHNVVVVDEKSQGGSDSGGSLHYFADLPGLVLAEGSSTAYGHIGVDTYRRLLALTDEYALDVFRVRGGRQHDLLLHSASTEVDFDGLSFDAPRPGSLAGAQYQWGDLQLNDGDMMGYPNKPYWNPPPGNGYGFLVRPRFARSEKHWSATWRLGNAGDVRFGLLALHDPQEQIVTALAPGIYPRFPKAAHVIRRRTGDNLSSCFVSVWQNSADSADYPVHSIGDSFGAYRSAQGLRADAPVAIELALADGMRDIWMVAPDSDGRLDSGERRAQLLLSGAIVRCRMKGGHKGQAWGAQLLEADLLDASSADVGHWGFSLDAPHRSAKVVQLPDGPPSITIDADWPTDGRYNGCPLYVSNPAYSRNSAYVIDHIEGRTIRLLQTNTLLGRGLIDSIPDGKRLISRIPHEYACAMGHCGACGFFRGKLLRAEDGSAAAHITRTALSGGMEIGVDSTAGFRVGQPIVYHDIQPGDTVMVHHVMALRQVSAEKYELQANTDAMLRSDGVLKIEYVDGAGATRTADEGRIPRASLPRSGRTTLSLHLSE